MSQCAKSASLPADDARSRLTCGGWKEGRKKGEKTEKKDCNKNGVTDGLICKAGLNH